ncbi:hypothetical protein F183_A30800 [Bryobacterales bacterium F-183]|nr:hypothetical protein F183_A30800 [Bryobacterales bacterium F-183]
MTSLLLLPLLLTQAQQQRFEDRTLPTAQWTATKLIEVNTGETEPKFTVEQRDGEYRAVKFNFRLEGGDYRLLLGHLRRASVTAANTPIQTVSFQFDIRTPTASAGLTFLPLIEQQGTFYIANPGTQALLTDWQTVQFNNLRATAFTKASGPGAERPDFNSATGFTLGFATDLAGRATCQGYYGECYTQPTVLRESHIRAWSVTVDSGPATPPTSAESDDPIAAGDPITTFNGEFNLEEADIDLGGPMPLRFTRYYAAFLRGAGVSSAVGLNWMHNFDITVSNLYRGKKISALAGSRYTDTAAGRIYVFDTSGRLASIEDRNGNVHRITRDPQGLITQVSDDLGRQLLFTHTNGRLTSVRDHTGRTVQFAHNTEGALISVANRAGEVTRYSYTPGTAWMQDKTLPSGTVLFRNTFDAQGRVTRQTDADGNTADLVFRGTTAEWRDALGSVTAYEHAGNNWTRIIDANGAEIRRGQQGRFVRQYQGTFRDLASITENGTPVVTYTRNAAGLPTRIVDTTHGVLTFEYNARGQVTVETREGRGTRRYAYNADGTLATLTLESGGVRRYNYDAQKRPTSITDPDGHVRTYTYDPEDRLLPAPMSTDLLRLVKRDAAGRLATADIPGGAPSLQYDAGGRLTSISDCRGDSLGFRYNAAGFLSAFTDGAGHTWTLDLNARGHATAVTSPLGRRIDLLPVPDSAWSDRLDATGRLLSRTDADGVTRSWTYDAKGFPSSIAGMPLQYRDGLLQTLGDLSTFEYDTAGRATQARNFRAAYAPLWMTATNGIGVKRDAAGHITEFDYGDGRIVRYRYDCRGLVSSVEDWTGAVTSLAYDGNRQVASIEFPNGFRTEYKRNPDGHIESIVHQRGDETYFINVERDLQGRPVTVQKRLPQPAPSIPTGIAEWTNTAAGRLQGLSYDASGRLTNDAAHTYRWNNADWLTQIDSVNVDYDGFARPVQIGDRTFLWNYATRRPTIARENGNRHHVTLPDGEPLYSIEPDGAHRFLHFDDTGSLAFRTSMSGSVADSFAFGPDGEPGSNDAVPLFGWKARDGVLSMGTAGLYWQDRRWYDPAAGRYLTTTFTGPGPSYEITPTPLAIPQIQLATRLAGLSKPTALNLLREVYLVLEGPNVQ